MTRISHILVILSLGFFIPCTQADAFLFHAASKSAARSIARSGFRKSLMDPGARFGRKAYLTPSLKTAQLEVPGAQSVARFRKVRQFNRRVIDTRKMTTYDLKSVSGMRDMRGTVKNGVIGPKLGHRLGRVAEKENKIIAYKSAKDAHGLNYALPEKSYEKGGRAIVSKGVRN